MISEYSKAPRRDKTKFSPDEVAARRRQVRHTLYCPHCDTKLSKWQVPDSPFNEWPSEFQFVCFNDACDYYIRGWGAMAKQGTFGSYRFMYDPPTGGLHPVAVLSGSALGDGIVETNCT
jgi:hypothetical protein